MYDMYQAICNIGGASISLELGGELLRRCSREVRVGGKTANCMQVVVHVMNEIASVGEQMPYNL